MGVPDDTTSDGELEPEAPRLLQPVPDTSDQPDPAERDEAHEDDGGEPVSGRLRQWLADVLTPQSGLYTDRQPSVRDTVLRAKHGTQTAETGLTHTAHVVDSWITAGGKIACRSAEWVWDHPARRIMLLVLLGLLILFPATRIGLGGLLWPLAQFDQWLLAN